MLAKRIIWKIAPLLGPWAARRAWDAQFTSGKWDYLRARDTRVAELVSKHADGGVVVDLGCGEGNLLPELAEGSYSKYVGVDVSGVAIANAARKAQSTGIGRHEFACCDLREWIGEPYASVILIEEALYYLTPAAQLSLLERCEQSLRPGGVLVVLVHDAARHPVTIGILTKRYGQHHGVGAGRSRFCMVVPMPEAAELAAV